MRTASSRWSKSRVGLTLGQLVGVPDKTDPGRLRGVVVAAAEGDGAKVTHSNGYAILPLETGQNVAVGVRGWNAT
jgi:hypothetical protein